MLTTLQTSYTDTRAGDLAWCLGGDPLPALAVRDLRLDGGRPGASGTLQLRLLGASHQVVISAGPGDCLETVACLPGRRTPLPARVAKQVGGWEYDRGAAAARLRGPRPGAAGPGRGPPARPRRGLPGRPERLHRTRHPGRP